MGVSDKAAQLCRAEPERLPGLLNLMRSARCTDMLLTSCCCRARQLIWLVCTHRHAAHSLLLQGSAINLAGMGATLLGLQATVGLLVAKTLTNATANPFLSGGQGSYNPVLALDVFLVQVLPRRSRGSARARCMD